MLDSGSEEGLFLEPEIGLISELQAPLLGIAANARVASERLSGNDLRIKEYLEAIEFSSKNLVRTIDILLRSRDAASAALSLDIEPLHVGLRVEEAIAKLMPLSRAQAQILDFKAKRNLIVSANSDCLELVVYHVLEQALRSSASEEIVAVELNSRGKMASLSIRASGCRERATSLRNSLKKSVGEKLGINFSLAASARLIDLMGGSFSISQRKDGVSFNIGIPLSRQGQLL